MAQVAQAVQVVQVVQVQGAQVAGPRLCTPYSVGKTIPGPASGCPCTLRLVAMHLLACCPLRHALMDLMDQD